MNNKLYAGTLFILLSVLAGFASEGTASAACYLYRGAYGQDVIARVDGGMVYKDQYGFDAVAHFKDDVVYKDDYGFDVIGHFKGANLFKERFGSEFMGRIKRGLVINEENSDAVGRVEGCTEQESAALGITLLSGLL